MAAEPFTFFELIDRGSNTAMMVYEQQIMPLIGSYASIDLLRKYAKYNRGAGHSVIRNFEFIPATLIDRDTKTVDFSLLVKKFIRNGYTAEDAKAFYDTIVQTRSYKTRMQVYPRTYNLQSDVMEDREAYLKGNGDTDAGYGVLAAQQTLYLPMLKSETQEHNDSLIKAFNSLVTNGIVYKRTYTDGGIDEEDQKLALPDYCKYTTKSKDSEGKGYFSVRDFLAIRRLFAENCIDIPDILQRQFVLLMSPLTLENFFNSNSDRNDLLNYAVFSGHKLGEIDQTIAGFTLESNFNVPDNKIYVFIPQVTVEVFDWGTLSSFIQDPTTNTAHIIRRSPNYGIMIAQPLAFCEVTIDGQDAYHDDRLEKITSDGSDTGDAIIKPLRKGQKSS